MNVLRVVRSLGGCGGTLVARVLAALPDVILLSECNPRSANLFGGSLNALLQIQKWYPEAAPDGFHPLEIGHVPLFAAFLAEVRANSIRHGKTLIIRDYNYADVIGVPFTTEPFNNLSLDLAIGDNVEIAEALLVRHPADQIASLRKHGAVARVLDPRRLMDGYMRLFAARPDILIFRYEDIFEGADQWFRHLCNALQLEFTTSALTDLSTNTRVTGNVERINEDIAKLPRSVQASEISEELRKETHYRFVINRLGYSA